MALLESNLNIVGCTALEDDLQDEVAECITDFREAGIKVWMLTGDMGKTARQIGFTCGLISSGQENEN